MALYDQSSRFIIGWADVVGVEVLLGEELKNTGTSWAPSRPGQPYYVYRLGPIQRVSMRSGGQMKGNRTGRYFITRLGLEVALEEQEPQLQFIKSWEQFIEWKTKKTRYPVVRVHRKRFTDPLTGQLESELEFIAVPDVESS
ncbi:hypothetical protein [Halomonas sp. BC04]|uniref:hypothetical protein n=1 Tax=Halomonas sp. BC04 TaxID=1403540 RepID=UPI0012DFB427|nr:hypothetical protein [Halomonas sp. BC04]